MIQRNGLWAVVGLLALACGGGEGSGTEGDATNVAAPGVEAQGLPIPPCLPPNTLVCNASCVCQSPPPPPLFNYALHRPAFQSSTLGGGEAGRATDGNTDGNWWDNSVTHTDQSMAGSWWYVDLGGVKSVRQVRIFNRTDCCTERLSHFNLWGWDGTQWIMISDQHTTDSTGKVEIDVSVSYSTQYVMLQKTDANYLSLAEMQVMGL